MKRKRCCELAMRECWTWLSPVASRPSGTLHRPFVPSGSQSDRVSPGTGRLRNWRAGSPFRRYATRGDK
jgi:hypothetical protein